MMTRVFIPTLVLALTTCCSPIGYAKILRQETSTPIIVEGHSGIDGTDCDNTKGFLDLIAQTAQKDGEIILIARRGDGEVSPTLIHRRLENLRGFLSSVRAVPNEDIVLAEGRRVRGLGQVEVYLNGKLFLIFRLKRNRDFAKGCET